MRMAAIAACCAFMLLGFALIPYAGIQNDEAVFANPLYKPTSDDFQVTVLHHEFPLMIVSYYGTLKTLLYWPILRMFRPGAFSLRIPVVLAGALTILGLYKFAESIASQRTALFACLLLAS